MPEAWHAPLPYSPNNLQELTSMKNNLSELTTLLKGPKLARMHASMCAHMAALPRRSRAENETNLVKRQSTVSKQSFLFTSPTSGFTEGCGRAQSPNPHDGPNGSPPHALTSVRSTGPAGPMGAQHVQTPPASAIDEKGDSAKKHSTPHPPDNILRPVLSPKTILYQESSPSHRWPSKSATGVNRWSREAVTSRMKQKSNDNR